ncbi:hypothetical protein MMPV_002988 [Pyropia vietnamensis]
MPAHRPLAAFLTPAAIAGPSVGGGGGHPRRRRRGHRRARPAAAVGSDGGRWRATGRWPPAPGVVLLSAAAAAVAAAAGAYYRPLPSRAVVAAAAAVSWAMPDWWPRRPPRHDGGSRGGGNGVFGAAPSEDEGSLAGAPLHRLTVLERLPHDRDAFTQGLLSLGDGVLAESTGLFGRSAIRRVDVRSGGVTAETRLAGSEFGEGLALLRSGVAVGFGSPLGNERRGDGGTYTEERRSEAPDRLLQLTWRQRVGYVYRAADLTRIGRFVFDGVDGWGLAALPGETAYALSDGSSVVRVVVPARRNSGGGGNGAPPIDVLAEIGRFTVSDGGRPVPLVNELQVVGGALLANVWMSPFIAVIDLTGLVLPPSVPRGPAAAGMGPPPLDDGTLPTAVVPPTVGTVTRWLDTSPLLLPDERRGVDVANGLADAARDGGGVWVTGKLWPWVYRVSVGEAVEGGGGGTAGRGVLGRRRRAGHLSRYRTACAVRESGGDSLWGA